MTVRKQGEYIHFLTTQCDLLEIRTDMLNKTVLSCRNWPVIRAILSKRTLVPKGLLYQVLAKQGAVYLMDAR